MSTYKVCILPTSLIHLNKYLLISLFSLSMLLSKGMLSPSWWTSHHVVLLFWSWLLFFHRSNKYPILFPVWFFSPSFYLSYLILSSLMLSSARCGFNCFLLITNIQCFPCLLLSFSKHGEYFLVVLIGLSLLLRLNIGSFSH